MTRAIVTGGASGIGAAVASLLRSRGASVVVLDRDRTDGIQVDVTDAAAVDTAVREAAEQLGGLDVVVNNAGVGAQGTVADNGDEEWHRVFDINVVGMVRVSRAALPFLRESDNAAIVNTCSVAATAGLPQRALYSATKGAVLSLTLAMAADHVGEGIRVNCVAPGTADTPWIGRLLDAAEDPEAERAALNARQPMGRLVSAEEVAEAIVYLATSTATTGTVLHVDGGYAGLALEALDDAAAGEVGDDLAALEEAGVGELLERVAALARLGLGGGELGAQLGGVAAGGVERGTQLDRVGAGGVDAPADLVELDAQLRAVGLRVLQRVAELLDLLLRQLLVLVHEHRVAAGLRAGQGRRAALRERRAARFGDPSRSCRCHSRLPLGLLQATASTLAAMTASSENASARTIAGGLHEHRDDDPAGVAGEPDQGVAPRR